MVVVVAVVPCDDVVAVVVVMPLFVLFRDGV
jgi:hypothetical protein